MLSNNENSKVETKQVVQNFQPVYHYNFSELYPEVLTSESVNSNNTISTPISAEDSKLQAKTGINPDTLPFFEALNGGETISKPLIINGLSKELFENDIAIFLVSLSYSQVILKEGEGERELIRKLSNTHFSAELGNFLSRKTYDIVDKIIKEMSEVNSKEKTLDNKAIRNSYGSHPFWEVLTSIFFESHFYLSDLTRRFLESKEMDETSKENFVSLIKHCIKSLKKLKAFIQTFGINTKIKNQLISDINIKLTDYDLTLGVYYFYKTQKMISQESKNDVNNNNFIGNGVDITALKYFSEALDLFCYVEKNGVNVTSDIKSMINLGLCAINLRVGSLYQAEKYAQDIVVLRESAVKQFNSKQKKNVITKISESDIIRNKNIHLHNVGINRMGLTKNIFADLAHRFYQQSKFASALKWYREAIASELDETNVSMYKFLEITLTDQLTEQAKKQQAALNALLAEFPKFKVTLNTISNDKTKKIDDYQIHIMGYGLNEDYLVPCDIEIIAIKLKNHAAEQINISSTSKKFADIKLVKDQETKNPPPSQPKPEIKNGKANKKGKKNNTNGKKKNNKGHGKEEIKNSNNNNRAINDNHSPSETDEEIAEATRLFGQNTDGKEIYPLRSTHLGGKAAFFGIFRPVGMTPVEYAQHELCVKQGVIGANIRPIPGYGFKTRKVSHSGSSETGDVRVAGRVVATAKTSKGNTIHLVDFNEVVNHKSQKKLY